MEDKKQDEQTEQMSASEQGLEGQGQQTPNEGQSASSDELNSIPQKFVGKSAAEILQAYQALEKESGRLRSELGSTRKEREDLERRYREIEKQRLQPMPTQAPPPQHNPQPDLDPFSALESKFDEDPKMAIKEALRRQQEIFQRTTQEQSIQQRAYEAQQYYWQQKQANQDFARRETLMQQAVQQYGDLIRPEMLNSVKTLQLLDALSRGMDIPYYERQAVERAKKDGLSSREEKRRAQSESSFSDGDRTVDIDKLSTAEIEKLYGFANK